MAQTESREENSQKLLASVEPILFPTLRPELHLSRGISRQLNSTIDSEYLPITNTVVLLHLHKSNFESFIDYDQNGDNPRGILGDIAGGLYHDESTTKWVNEDIQEIPETWTSASFPLQLPGDSNDGYGAISVQYGFSDDGSRVIRTLFMVLMSGWVCLRLPDFGFTHGGSSYQAPIGHLLAGLSVIRGSSAEETVLYAQHCAEISPMESNSEAGYEWKEISLLDDNPQSISHTKEKMWKRVSDLARQLGTEPGLQPFLHIWASKESKPWRSVA